MGEEFFVAEEKLLVQEDFHKKLFKQNILANYVGQGWSALMGIVFIPLYISFLGVESYGIIGIYATLYAIFNLLDLGMTATMNREMARFSTQPERAHEARDFARTFEVIYWVFSLVIGLVVIGLAPFIAERWVNSQSLPVISIKQAISLMGLLLFFHWPLSLYQGGLIGLQKQVVLNIINLGTSTLKGLGSVLVIWLVSPTIQAFFIWQLLVVLCQIGITVFFFWRFLPRSKQKPTFRFSIVKSVWRFAAGLGFASIASLFRSQIDKIILSRILSLETFGYYVLASNVGNALSLLSGPIFNATFPRLSAMIKETGIDSVKNFFHRTSQLVAAIIIPICLLVAAFSFEIVLLWTRSNVTAENTTLTISVLAIGTMINSLVGMPYELQIASGWVKLTVYKNIITLIILVPLIYYLSVEYGTVGAAFSWLVLNIGYLFIEMPIMFNKLLKSEMKGWYLNDVALPLIPTSIVAIFLRLIFDLPKSYNQAFVNLAISTIALFIIVSLFSPIIRNKIISLIPKRSIDGRT